MTAASEQRAGGLSALTLGTAAGACLGVIGWAIGLRSLSDNSFFTHLATGRLILDTGSVPAEDPYTFTAGGEPWVVQSWLASVLYAGVEALGGETGLRVLMGLVAAGLTVLAWMLTRRADALLLRLALGAIFVTVGAQMWSERPFMLGLIALALTMLAVDGRLDPRWLVPIAWLWVNVHGSFPLGVGYILVVLAGLWLDRQDLGAALASLRWLGLGIALGAVSPLGPRVLLFPMELLSRQDVLSQVVEWRAPTFDSLSQRVFVLQIVLAIVAVTRRPSYRSALVVGVFTAAALLGARNISVASLVLLPVLAAAAPEVGSLRSSGRDRVARMLGVAAVAGFVLMTAVRLGQPGYELSKYPIDGLAYLERQGVERAAVRLATPDIVGNLQEVIYGADGAVFYDDRFDMFPTEITEIHQAAVNSAPGVRAGLERLEIDLVLWNRSGGVSRWLAADSDWRLLYTDERWSLYCKRGAALGDQLNEC